MGSEPFRIELADHSLVVTFDRPSNVLSWLPLHGGFRYARFALPGPAIHVSTNGYERGNTSEAGGGAAEA